MEKIIQPPSPELGGIQTRIDSEPQAEVSKQFRNRFILRGIGVLAVTACLSPAIAFAKQPAENRLPAAISLEIGSIVSQQSRIGGIRERSVPRDYRCDGKKGEPVPGWKWCPKKRGDDIVPKSGWTVAPKSFAHRFVSARKQILDQSLRKPIPTDNMRFGPYMPELSFYLPYDPKYGFAKPIDFHLSRYQQAFWSAIHSCEGAWNDSGDPYYGGLQMDQGFMNNYGADLRNAYAKYRGKPNTMADSWTHVEQQIVGERGKQVQGAGAWPVCSARLGY